MTHSSTGNRPRLLFLSQSLPYPPTSGVTNRTYHILEQLQREFDVTLLAFSRVAHQRHIDAMWRAHAALSEVVSEVAPPVRIPSQVSLARQAWDHARSIATGQAYTYYEYSAAAFARQLDRMSRRGFDLVHLDSLDLYRWADGFDVPVTCTHHNIESELLRLRAIHLDHPLLSRYVAFQGRRTESVERALTRSFALNLMMSSIDEERLRRLAPGARTTVIPNGVDTEKLQPGQGDTGVAGRVVFLGPLYMFPNRDGIEFFIEDVWPLVRQSRPDATLHLVGAASARDRRRLDKVPGVTCHGFVDDIRVPINAAECCIVPLRVGGGTRLKLLDYWALGKAVVSTAVGAEGLAVREGENILLRETAGEFARATVAVLDDADLRSRIGNGARRTAEEVYDWRRIGDKLLAEYADLLT